MRVLGIDPVSVSSGYGIVDEEGSSLFLVEAGGITASSRLAFPQRLHKIYHGYRDVIEKHRPDFVSVESLFFAKNVQSALKLGQARGVAILAAVDSAIPIFEYSASEIKQSVVGYGQAEKAQVQQMVKALLKLADLPKPHDASDALAAAICHIHSSRLKEAVKRARG